MLVTNFTFSQFSRNQAIDLVLNQILDIETETIDVYSSYNVVSSSNITLWDNQTINCSYSENWLFFIDDIPPAKWYHPCRYIFVDKSTGNYTIVNKKIYPKDIETDYELIHQIPRPDPADELMVGSNSSNQIIEPNPHYYAVIINGFDCICNWGDVSSIYTTLIDYYGIWMKIYLFTTSRVQLL